DRLLPTVCNVGILGYSNYAEHKKEYNIWCDIIKRCYNKKHKSYKSYGGKGVAVCDRWKRFDLFLEDIKFIDGYNEEKFHNGCLQLDKDIKQQNISIEERIYSIETCSFVSQKLNMEYEDRNVSRFLAMSP